MTIRLKKFGQALVTRQDAHRVLDEAGSSAKPKTLDCTGVSVANHSFADELGKGLISQFGPSVLTEMRLKGANSYVKNGVQAGFFTAGKS